MENGIIITKHSSDTIYTLMYHSARLGAYTSYIRGKRCKSEVDIIREISASFQFPNYFGDNFNAMDECLTDLEWLNFGSILVIVDDYSQIFDGDEELKQCLLRRFHYMTEYWIQENVPITIMLNN